MWFEISWFRNVGVTFLETFCMFAYVWVKVVLEKSDKNGYIFAHLYVKKLLGRVASWNFTSLAGERKKKKDASIELVQAGDSSIGLSICRARVLYFICMSSRVLGCVHVQAVWLWVLLTWFILSLVSAIAGSSCELAMCSVEVLSKNQKGDIINARCLFWESYLPAFTILSSYRT